ncbi:Modular serine protease [Eumeta japonica]|uniref:Modular serine protease n=1 Tax=Eumeta variegata TaxID=151549 RepID=A0A4C1V4W2_EUMVA|nr:Modular serine protease [Eumeta japonica]
MHQILILFLVCWLTKTAENSNALGTLLGTTIDEYTDDDETSTASCQLPPYPAHGGYVVLNAEHAKPGDLFANVSLIQYTTDESYNVFEIKRLTCTLGEWYQDILEYQSTTLQFFTSWCPFFCSRFFSDRRTENSSPSLIHDPKKLNSHKSKATEGSTKENDTSSTSCRLPPYPDHGTYIVPDHPNAKPGDVFQEVSLIQYTSDESNTVVGIEHFKCSAGSWNQKIFREASEKLQFHTSWCPSLCSNFLGGVRIDCPVLLRPIRRCHIRTFFLLLLSNLPAFSLVTAKVPKNSCIQPPYPKFGNYSILSATEPSKPGDVHDVLRLNYTCDAGYNVTGNRNVYCLNGTWSDELPKCTKFCHLNRQPGVEYLCESLKAEGSVNPCNDYHEDGGIIYPQCNRPYYTPKSTLKPMICVNGEWDNLPKCKPVCGLRLQRQDHMETDARIKAPWNVAVYSTNLEPYEHICGGSIVAPNLVISGKYLHFNIL